MTSSRKESVTYHEIDDASEGQRLDNFLIRVCKGVPKSRLYRVIRSGEVRVNGGRVAVDYRLQLTDRVRVPPLRLADSPTEVPRGVSPASSEFALPVIHEDDWLLAVDKPAGIAVHGGSGVAWGLIESLRVQRPQARFLELAHRLDKDTSGVLLLAKRRSTLRRLHELFRAGGLDKRYRVMVAGRWPHGTRHVRLALGKTHDDNGTKHVFVDDEGQAAYSIFSPLALGERASLLEARIKTGRTHQIRVHLAHLGFPVLGDERYGDFALNRELRRQGLRRMFLHASTLTLTHPETGCELRLRSPLATDLVHFLQTIGPLDDAIDVTTL